VYVYQPFVGVAPGDWAAANDELRAQGMTVFAQTALAGQAVAGHFSGLYTYDIVTYGARVLGRLCGQAHRVGLLCAPSVGPGYDARRAAGDPRVKPRRHGQTYDSMWHAAISGGADRVTITSFNEWQEGTQIEPAVPLRLGEYRYVSYDGAWGLHGAAAGNAYLTRTAYWSNLFRKAAARPKP
jgi:glycoprotein endo-alpha-1,2-mannosidase